LIPPPLRDVIDLLQRQDKTHLPNPHNDGSIKRQQQSPMSHWIGAEELNCNSIYVDLATVAKEHWAARAIKGAVDDGK
jgi:hypothetical protein